MTYLFKGGTTLRKTFILSGDIIHQTGAKLAQDLELPDLFRAVLGLRYDDTLLSASKDFVADEWTITVELTQPWPAGRELEHGYKVR